MGGVSNAPGPSSTSILGQRGELRELVATHSPPNTQWPPFSIRTQARRATQPAAVPLTTRVSELLYRQVLHRQSPALLCWSTVYATGFASPLRPSGQTNKEKDFSFLLQQHTPTSSTTYNATMATNLSLATALATPTLPTSITHSGHGPMADVGRKGKKLFIRNVSF